MNLMLQDEQGTQVRGGLVNMLDIDGHGRRVRWPGSVSVKNHTVVIGFAFGLFTMGNGHGLHL